MGNKRLLSQSTESYQFRDSKNEEQGSPAFAGVLSDSFLSNIVPLETIPFIDQVLGKPKKVSLLFRASEHSFLAS